MFNSISRRYNEDASLNMVELKRIELKPLIENIFERAKTVKHEIEEKGENTYRSSSERLKKAIRYLTNNEAHLKTFIDSPYGLMHNNHTEETFREFDILRNSCIESDTVNGAENLALFYSLYKSSQINGLNFKSYLEKVISVMTLNMDKIEFKKDRKGTITDFESHSIPDVVLDTLLPWIWQKIKGLIWLFQTCYKK